jgi:hypothetical protein
VKNVFPFSEWLRVSFGKALEGQLDSSATWATACPAPFITAHEQRVVLGEAAQWDLSPWSSVLTLQSVITEMFINTEAGISRLGKHWNIRGVMPGLETSPVGVELGHCSLTPGGGSSLFLMGRHPGPCSRRHLGRSQHGWDSQLKRPNFSED